MSCITAQLDHRIIGLGAGFSYWYYYLVMQNALMRYFITHHNDNRAQ
jgi:hypothetical protein